MKFWIRALSLCGLSALTLASLAGCESGEDRTMASAQSCLDGARDASAAQRCVELVQGLETQDAYMVRCSAAFIANGFSGQKIADAYLTLSKEDSPSGPDPMVSIMAYLNFNSQNQNFTPTAAVSNCERSGVRSMYQLATAANLSSTLTSIGGIDLSTVLDSQQAIQDLIDGLADDIQNGVTTPDLTELGNVAVVANTAFCTGVANPNQDVCDTLRNAITGHESDPVAIAEQLISLLK